MTPVDHPPHWHAWTPQEQAAVIDRDSLRRLVLAFYDRVRSHPDLGPVFENTIQGNWQPHLDKMVEFWCSMMLGTRTYDGRPLPAHLALPDLQDHHFTQWLALFRATTADVFCPEPAEQLCIRAERMAASFRMALAIQRGERTF